MRIGIDTGISSRIDGALAGINYQYTWAFDASKQTTVDTIAGYDTFGATIVDDGINLDFNAETNQSMVFQEADFTAGSISGGSVIPDGAAPATASDAIGHHGRFFSTVVTIHDLTIADGEALEIFAFFLTNASNGIIISRQTLGQDPSHINGDRRALASGLLTMSQSEINSFIGRPVAITYDLLNSYYFGTADDDLTHIELFPAYNESVDMNATIHGMILSDLPPRIYHLPISINNPSI